MCVGVSSCVCCLDDLEITAGVVAALSVFDGEVVKDELFLVAFVEH